MKRWVYKDEWWPVYSLRDADDDTDFEVQIDVPDDVVRRYETYLRGFSEVQDELEAIYDKAKRDAQA